MGSLQIMNILNRFLKYVNFTTTSDESSESCPSTPQQLVLAKYLTEELESIGLSQVKMDKNGYVYGLLPATAKRENDTPIGFISHMDTSPDFSGVSPKPQIIEDYDGADVLLKGSGATLKVDDFPTLKWLKGRTLITTDGTTLLGADDKAGIAEIVTAMEELIEADRHAESRGYENLSGHGDIWVCFTPDEEIGRGADCLDMDYFKAKYAYTVDGGYEGEIAYENFNAASATFKIHGKGVHPGEAKGIMKNASLMAAEIAMALPENETPATTEGREGFYHLTDMQGDVTEAKLDYIVRDHDQTRFEDRQNYLKEIAEKFNEKFGGTPFTIFEKNRAGGSVVEVKLKHSYSNMLQIVEKTPEILDRARSAIESEGINAVSDPVRGGTDGAKLSFMGLPCPNLGTGGYGFHGPYEHITVEGMQTVVRIIKKIAEAKG